MVLLAKLTKSESESKMKKYTWAWWNEDEYTGIFTLDTLENLVKSFLLNHHAFNPDSVIVKLVDGQFNVEIFYCGESHHYDFEETEQAVCNFFRDLTLEIGIAEEFRVGDAIALIGT